jgi:plasmid maintenance system antidote protein VapI
LKLTEKQLHLLRRRKGELNISINTLAGLVGISRWTMAKIINFNANVRPTTASKVNEWLLDQYSAEYLKEEGGWY